jgi:hypothetical protein
VGSSKTMNQPGTTMTKPRLPILPFAAAALAMALWAGGTSACSLAPPPKPPTVQQAKANALKSYRSGTMIAVAVVTSINDVLTLTIVRSFDPRLPVGVRSRRPGVLVPCGNSLSLDERRLAWIDPDPRSLPTVVTRAEVEALLEAGLIKDRSILDYVR